MPGRKCTPVLPLFIQIIKPGSKAMVRCKCKFCSKEVAKNGTRLEDHVLKCLKISDDIKVEYLKDKIKGKAKKLSKTEILRLSLGSRRTETANIHNYLNSEYESNQSEAIEELQCDVPLSSITNILSNKQSQLEELSKLESNIETESTETSSVVSSSSTMVNCSKPKQLASHSLVAESAKKPVNSSKVTQSPAPVFADKMPASQSEQITEHLARAIYATGSPLSLVENKHWLMAFEFFHPAYKPPTRYQLTSNLLENEYHRVKLQCDNLLSNSSTVGLLCDTWTNIRHGTIVSFVLTTPAPVFWRSVPTGSENHTGEYMAKEISKIIEEVGPAKVLGVCSDNSINMRNAWGLISKKYIHINCYGCVSHGLNLIFTDILNLKILLGLFDRLCTIIRNIKSSHLLLTVFKEKQAANKITTMLTLPVKTRLRSTLQFLLSVLSNKSALKSLVTDERDSVKKALNKEDINAICDDVFWNKVSGFTKLLKQIFDSITIVEKDSPMISDVIRIFSDIRSSISENCLTNPLMKDEAKEMLDILEKRRTFCVKPIHLAANLLDPRYRGQHLTKSENVDACEIIVNIANQMDDVNSDLILGELASYNAKQELFAKQFLWSGVTHSSPVSWWLGLCSTTQLSKVAGRILGLPATTTAAVRGTFGTYDHVQSKKRNRLSNLHVSKLTFIKHNLKLLDTDTLFASAPQEPSSSCCSTASGLPPATSVTPTSSHESLSSDSIDVDNLDIETEELMWHEQEDSCSSSDQADCEEMPGELQLK